MRISRERNPRLEIGSLEGPSLRLEDRRHGLAFLRRQRPPGDRTGDHAERGYQVGGRDSIAGNASLTGRPFRSGQMRRNRIFRSGANRHLSPQ